MTAPVDDCAHSLRGVVALVTGGGRGLGRLTAEALAAAGASVGLIARTESEVRDAADAIRASGGVAAAATADVSEEARIAAAVDSVVRELGPIDVLVNNAGVNGPIAALADVDMSSWWRTMEINVGGAARCCRLVLPGMLQRGRGRIINVTSAAGAYRWPTVSAYSVSKAALIRLTENVAAEVRRQGVSVFSFHPGLLPIGLAQAGMESQAAPGSPAARVAAWARKQQAAGHFSDPQRAAACIVALASGVADALTGRYLTIEDDLDDLVSRLDDVVAGDRLTLRVREMRRLPV